MLGVKILRLDEVGRQDVLLAGGKGANLGELVRQGFPVPPGFIVPAQACEEFFRSLSLHEQCRSLGGLSQKDLDQRCAAIRNTISGGELSPDLSADIMAAYDELSKRSGRPVMCAVRSSATAEDLGEASFAGQHQTFYYVEADGLIQMVKHCWASLWNPEAVSYREAQGIDHTVVFMAVVVQEMVESEISGVTFSANPVTGSRDEVITESSWGMGAAIVDGRVTPDRYIMDRPTLKVREKRIAHKKVMVPPRVEKGARSRLVDVPHWLCRSETLSEDAAGTVAAWAIKAEEHFGNPQDIEWAFADGQFYMLQSRPITVMGHEDFTAGVEDPHILFKPVAENFTDPLSPLTADLVSIMFPKPAMCIIGGRIYMSLKHVRALLPYKATDEDLVRLIYGLEANPPEIKLSLLKLPLFLAGFFFAYLGFGVLYARTRRIPDGFMDRFRDLAGRLDADSEWGPLETFTRLLLWSRFLDPVGHLVIPVNLTAVRYIFFFSILRSLLRFWIPSAPDDAGALLCSGSAGVLSAEMGRGIWRMAKAAKESPVVRRILETTKQDRVLDALRTEPEAEEFLGQLDRFLAMNGHRGLKELELSSPRWEEDPAPVLGMVRNYLLIETDPSEYEKKTDEARQNLEREMATIIGKLPLERLFHPRWRLIRYVASRTKYFAKMRENSRFYHIMGFNIVRRKLLRLEETFLRQGRLRCKGDIFCLRWPEVARLKAGELLWRDVEERIRQRRLEYVRLSKITPPRTIGLKLPESRERAESPGADVTILTGQSASPGQYKGIARVILDPSVDIELKPGEILIAPYTDPAWTPLFLTAGAAVVEVGSYLSHAGTIAREYGMPCVVDVPGCTSRIQTGMQVSVNGYEGSVKIGESIQE